MPYFSAEAPGLSIRNCWFSDTARSRTWSDAVNEHGRDRTLRRDKRVVCGAVVKPALLETGFERCLRKLEEEEVEADKPHQNREFARQLYTDSSHS